jgi:hypothetical protein
MIVRHLSVVLAVGAAGALAACGDDSNSESSSAPTTGPGVALREVRETRSGLEQALAAYRRGDAAAAEDQVSEAYVSHFEEVEGPLEKVDPELNEELEDGIREGLREQVRSRKPVARVEKAFRAIFAQLDRAEAALR